MVTLATETPTAHQTLPFTFNGSGTEYFKIWIVNILLTIITLGIYSAWAKVRNKQYFYGNTVLDNAAFEYTAKPIQILKGRIIAVLALFLVNIIASFNPLLGLLLFALLFIATPWIVMKALAFNAKNSRYRNIHFNFKQDFAASAKVFILLPILSVFTLHLLLPYIQYKFKQYLVSNHFYGKSAFDFTLTKSGKFYEIYITALSVTIAVLIALFLAYKLLIGSASEILLGPIVSIVTVLFYLFLFSFINSRIYNLTYNHSTIQQHAFKADMTPQGLAKLYFVNTLGIILTLGLFIPWAKIRSAKYRAEHTHLLSHGELSAFIAQETGQDSVLAEELGEQFGDALDIDLGI